MPLSRPEVQTLVAMKALLRVPAAASRSPTTASAAPYIGEVSITEPPASNRTLSTSASGARSSGRRPTSKVRQVPQPTMGSISPEEGILRWCMRVPVCARVPPAASTVAPASPSKVERVKVMSCQGDLEGLSGDPDIGGTPIQGHARRLGKSRDCEGLGGVAVLSRSSAHG